MAAVWSMQLTRMLFCHVLVCFCVSSIVEFDNVEVAARAINELDGQEIGDPVRVIRIREVRGTLYVH
jgi:hypothetical protein